MIKINLPCVATIAGTDPSGGAGIQADIKSIAATGSYAASIVTALVAQNTQGVQAVFDIPAEFVMQQIHSVFTDLTISAIKIGMLHHEAIMSAVLSASKQYDFKNIVLDPVMVAKDGSPLLNMSDLTFLTNKLFPEAYLITPNLIEAEHILAQKIMSFAEMEQAAEKIAKHYQTNVLLKGGHMTHDHSSDVLYLLKENQLEWFHAKRIHTKNTHGTGCTLSSAIASYLAQDYSLIEAIRLAKIYLTHAIEAGCNIKIGRGNGPVNHFYML